MSARAARRAAIARKSAELKELLDADEQFVEEHVESGRLSSVATTTAVAIPSDSVRSVGDSFGMAPGNGSGAADHVIPGSTQLSMALASSAVVTAASKKRNKARGSRGGDRKRHKPYQLLSWEEKLQLQDEELRAAAAAVDDRGA